MVGMRASEEMILKLLFLDRCSSVHGSWDPPMAIQSLKTMEGRMLALWISLGLLKLSLTRKGDDVEKYI